MVKHLKNFNVWYHVDMMFSGKHCSTKVKINTWKSLREQQLLVFKKNLYWMRLHNHLQLLNLFHEKNTVCVWKANQFNTKNDSSKTFPMVYREREDMLKIWQQGNPMRLIGAVLGWQNKPSQDAFVKS